MAKATLTPAQVKAQVSAYVAALKAEGKSTVKRVRIVGTLADAQVGTQKAIAEMLTDGIKAAGLSVNLDTARAQIGHALTAFRLTQRFALTADDTCVNAAVSISTGAIKADVREKAFEGISSDDMTAERFLEIVTALKAERKLKSAKAVKPEVEAGEIEGDPAAEIENLNDDVSLVADAQKVLSQFAAILKLAKGDDADAILSLFTEFSESLLG